jgi:hypothetical protein
MQGLSVQLNRCKRQLQSCPRIHWFSIRGLPWPEKIFETKINKRFISFKTRAKREQTVTRWNPAAQTRPVLDSSLFVPVTMLPRRTFRHSASSVLAVRISCRVIAVFVLRKLLFINKTLLYLCMLHGYHVIYSVRHYPRFHVTALGLGTYYPLIRGHYCITQH